MNQDTAMTDVAEGQSSTVDVLHGQVDNVVESFLADEPTSADIEAASHKLSEAALYLKGIIQDRMNREKPEALSENAHDNNKQDDNTTSDVFDASSILPDSVIEREHKLPYNETWMEDHNVPESELQRFEEWGYSKHKWLDLFRFGALKQNDELSVPATSSVGQAVQRWAVVAGVGSEKGNRNLPQIAIESGLGGGHLAEGKYYVKTKELVQDMEQHFGDQQGTSRESYAIISVWRNGINIGTIEKIRAKHHLWELCVRHWARKYDKKEYAGKINKKTGKYYPSPALGKRRRAKKDEE